MKLQTLKYVVALAAASAIAWAQPGPAQGVGPGGGAPGGPPPPVAQGMGRGGGVPGGPLPPVAQGGRGRGMNAMAGGKWWDNPEISARLGVSDEQKKKMDDIFQASRIKLIDLRASLEKEEAMLDPLMQAATPDDSKLLPQIDKVAQARAELEKANARLLLGIRHVLSPQQWQNLQADRNRIGGGRGQQPRPAQGRGPGGQPAPPGGQDFQRPQAPGFVQGAVPGYGRPPLPPPGRGGGE